MLTEQRLIKLREALIKKFGSEVTDCLSSEKLSIAIFLKSGNYVSRSTIMHLFGLVEKPGSINSKILDFLDTYANRSIFDQVNDNKSSKD